MSLEKVTWMNSLYDLYEPLLTAKQKEYFEQYYQEDLSLNEIAGQYGISRNAVFDNIKRTEKLLENYEDKLGLFTARQKRLELLSQVQGLSNITEATALIQKIIALEESEE